LNRKDFVLFFLLPFMGTALVFLIISALNRASVDRSVEGLVREQLRAASGILTTDIGLFLSQGASPAGVLDAYAAEENIYFMAVLDEEKNVLAWRSKFEGYLPLSLRDIPETDSWIIDSPAGEIFSLFTAFSPSRGNEYYLYLGYSLAGLENMRARSKRNLLILFGIFAAAGGLIFRGVSVLQTRYLEKKAEAEEARTEREHFKEISAFTSGIAHEIKNPLNSLSLIFELLNRKLPPETRKDIELGRNEVRKISGILDQFSGALKPFHLRREIFPLGEAVPSVFESLAREFPLSRPRLRFDRGAEITLTADRNLFCLSLFNILKNSLQASEKGEIAVTARRIRKWVRIEVRDQGPGIPTERIERIFEPFFSTKKEGMGIGLYLTKKIIDAHGGRIEVRSRPGEGTVFSIQVAGG